MSIGVMELTETTRIGKLFLQTRKRKGLTQNDIAKKIGHTAARISQVETGGQLPSEDIALKIASKLHLDLNEVLRLLQQDRMEARMKSLAIRQPNLIPEDVPIIVSGEIGMTQKRDKANLESIGVHWVHVIGIIPGTGPIEVVQQEVEDQVPVELSRVSDAVRLFALRVEGNTMIKWGIQDGDIVVVDPDAQWTEGDEVVVIVNDEWTLKKIRRVSGGILLEAASNDQSMILTETPGDVELKGVVVHLKKDRRRVR